MPDEKHTGLFAPVSVSNSQGLAASTPQLQETAPFPRREVLPRKFGRYELRKLLGKGGMGAVYLAHEPDLDRMVALKIPRPLLEDSDEWRRRFLLEARAAATFQHPNICPVFEVGEIDSQPYLAMAYIEGETLEARLRREPVTEDTAVEMVSTVAQAMAEAHERGIVHRDLKPANIMIDRRGQPIVMDFGLALRPASDDLRLTLTGVAMGTPSYMPPEQAGGDPSGIGPPSDVYALGVILFELVTRRLPFEGATFGKLLAKIERDPPPKPTDLNPKTNSTLERIILKTLEKDPENRFADARTLAIALDSIGNDDASKIIDRLTSSSTSSTQTFVAKPSGRRSRPRRMITAIAAFAFLAFVAGVIYVRTDYGDLVVELSDAADDVTVTVNGQEVILQSDGKPIRVRAGSNQKLVVTSADFETFSDTFDLKRNGEKKVHVTLRPREGAPDTKETTAPAPADTATPADDPLREVAFPEAPTIIAQPGWETIVGANKEIINAWLEARRAAKHSVTWLDVVLVGEVPLYSAVAALDARQPDWVAAIDLPADDFGKGRFPTGVSLATHYILSASGFATFGQPQCAILWAPGTRQYAIVPDATEPTLLAYQDEYRTKGAIDRLIRPYPVGGGETRTAWCAERKLGVQSISAHDLTASKLRQFLDEHEAVGDFITSFSAYPKDGKLLYAVVAATNPAKTESRLAHDLTVEQLQSRNSEFGDQGFRPDQITACPWDGAVRYAAIWVKDPQPEVVFPDAPTIIAQLGWETIVGANKEAMNTWLEARRAAKHSVTWLDAVLVGDAPLYSAIAALDDRQPDWVAAIDARADDFSRGRFPEGVAMATHHVLSASGFASSTQSRSAILWVPGSLQYVIVPDATDAIFREGQEKFGSQGAIDRLLRPYSVGGGQTCIAWCAERRVGVKSIFAYDQTESQLRRFLEERQATGDLITSFSAYPKDGKLLYSVVAVTNLAKTEFRLDHDLTVDQLQSKNTKLADEGFRPDQITACPWDGAVRYAAVWVKDSAGPTQEPGKPDSP